MIKKILTKKNKALLSELVRTDFKLRYQGSVLGYLWSLLRPLLFFFILYIVFVQVFKVGEDIPHFPVYLLLGIVLWNFFTEMTMMSLGSIVGRGDLIRKIKIPRWIIVMSTSVSALINLCLNMLVVVAFMMFDGVDLLKTSLLVPFNILLIYLLALGVSLFLSAAYVKYRDINYVWEVALQAGFYATPILYPLTLITSVQLQKLIFLNPLAVAIQDARYNMVSHDPRVITFSDVYPNPLYMLIPIGITLIVLFVGVSYFRRQSRYFAENI